jgi:hypothetical protein
MAKLDVESLVEIERIIRREISEAQYLRNVNAPDESWQLSPAMILAERRPVQWEQGWEEWCEQRLA